MYAVIDIGTNTLILLIAKKNGRRGFKVVSDEAVITRLGKGLTDNHFFTPDAMDRTLEVLKHFKSKCEKKKVKKIITVATAACRIAANAKVFTDSVKKDCGLKVDVISGNREAEYVFHAAWHDFQAKKKIIVVDIGGGSTEVITGPLLKKGKAGGPESVLSLQMGSVRFTEHFVNTDPISEDQFNRLLVGTRNFVADELGGFFKDFDPNSYKLVATAGTATTLAAIDRKIKKYSARAIHGKWLKKESLEKIIQILVPLSIKERQRLPGMEPMRADVILAGALILNELMRFFKKKEALISDRGLRYGVLYKNILKM